MLLSVCLCTTVRDTACVCDVGSGRASPEVAPALAVRGDAIGRTPEGCAAAEPGRLGHDPVRADTERRSRAQRHLQRRSRRRFVSDIATFVLKRDAKLQLTPIEGLVVLD